jgi:hypothetical protein
MSEVPSQARLKEIRTSIEKALNKVCLDEKLDSLKLGKITFDANGFKSSVVATFQGGDTPEIRDLKFNAELLGFNKEIAGAEIKYANKNFKVIGLKRTNLSLESLDDGKVYTAKIDQILKSLQLQKSPLVKSMENILVESRTKKSI